MVIALVLVLALLLTGTLAWQSQQQQTLNQARGTQFPGGRLHDDFEVIGPNFGEEVWQFGVRANKDVYVENFNNIRRVGPYATAAELTAALDGLPPLASGYVAGVGYVAYVELRAAPIFVALRVFEYMEFGDGALEDPDPHHYTAFSGPDGAATGVTTTNAARGVTSLAPGAERYDVTTWTLREWDNYSANTLLFRRQWNWELGGQKTFMPTFNRDNESEESDVKGDAVAHTLNSEPLRGGEAINETIRRVDNVMIRPNVTMGQDVYPAEAGLHNFFAGQPTWTTYAKFNDDGTPSVTQLPITHTARPTLHAETIYMAAWIAEDFSSVTATSRETFVGWILDVDGWAYWSQMLEPGDATGLLIDEIEFVGRMGGTWYYAIHIEASITNLENIAELAPGRTLDGDRVVNWMAPIRLSIVGSNVAMIGDSITLNTAVSAGGLPLASAPPDVAWTINSAGSPNAGQYSSTDNSFVFSPVAGGNETYLITATSLIDATVFATHTVTVTENFVLDRETWNPGLQTMSQVVNVTSNTPWTVSDTLPYWLTVTPMSGGPGGSFTMNVTTNLNETRSAPVTVTGTEMIRTVTVTQSGGASTLPYIPGVGGTFTYNGIVWRVLHNDGAGHRLIITERVHMVGARYNTTNIYTRLGVSNARAALNNWWGPNVTGALGNVAVPALNVENDVRSAHGSWNNNEQGAAGISAPGSGAVQENGSNALFILSLSEVNRYFTNTDGARRAALHGGTATNWQPWWLRSPGNTATNRVAGISTAGHRNARPANNTEPGLRPAMWIHIGY